MINYFRVFTLTHRLKVTARHTLQDVRRWLNNGNPSRPVVNSSYYLNTFVRLKATKWLLRSDIVNLRAIIYSLRCGESGESEFALSLQRALWRRRERAFSRHADWDGLIRASVPKRNWKWAAVSLGERLSRTAKALPRSGYVLQRILKYFNCSGSRGTLEGFIRNHSIESMNRD